MVRPGILFATESTEAGKKGAAIHRGHAGGTRPLSATAASLIRSIETTLPQDMSFFVSETRTTQAFHKR